MLALRYNITLFAFFLLVPVTNIFAQTDVDFWFVAPEVTIGHGDYPGGEPVYFRVSALDLDATVRIYQPANSSGMDTTFNVSANTTVSIDASPWIDQLENRPGDQILNKGVHITSSNLITVYYDEDEYWNQDIFALKGRNALGREFYAPFNNVWSNGNYTPQPYSSIDIVATEDNTIITITPTASIVGHAAGTPFNITLDRGETYSCLAVSQTAAGHLGGTHIVSNDPNKPIAVTIKDDSVAGNVCRDLIGDQTVPIVNADNKSIVGYEYIVMRGKINLIDPSAAILDPDGVPTGERIFILATQPLTTVSIDGVPLPIITNAGEQAVYEIRNNSTHVLGNKPIMILHTSGFGCELGGAILPTIDGCTGSLEVSFTRSTDRDFYLNIMTIDAAKSAFTMYYEDGSTFVIPGGWFEPVGATGFVCLTKTNKYFANGIAGGVPQGEVVKITNSVGVFHLGLIEGGRTSGCKYGYFSDYSVSRGGVVVVETGSKSIFRCFGDTVQLRADGGLTYTWTPSSYLDDPFVATPKAAPPPGVYNYDVTLTRACFPDTTFTVIVGIAPEVEAFFEMDKWYICAPETVTLDNMSTGVDMSSIYNMQWDFDYEDPGNSYVYDTSAVMQRVFTNSTDSVENKTIQLLVWNSQGCASEFKRDIIVRPEINASFTNDVSDGCHPVNVNFTNTSTGNTNRYKWTLGDGNSAIKANVSHTYLNQGLTDIVNHVEMVAISPFFCSDTFETDISVYPYLEAAYAIDTFQGCSPLTISIDNNSAGYIEEYEWTFGDGDTSSTSAATLSHTYTNLTGAPVQHNLRLVVKNNARGCTDTVIRVISVYPEVSSDFTQDNTSGCHGIKVSFTDQSTTTATMFEWDFDDGGSSSSRDPVHEYENMTMVNADFNVRLVSTTPNLCRDTSYQTIRVHPYILSEFSVDEFQGCAPFEVVLQNGSDGAVASHEWDWGDGFVTTSPGPKQTHLYQNNTPGAQTYLLQLVVANADGCTDTMIRNITVFPEVTSQFTADLTAGCNQLQVSFSNTSSASATSFLWEFGDGGSSSDTLDLVQHLFQNFGLSDTTYTSRLISVTDEDCTDTSEVDITVYSYVKADFTFSQGTVCTPFNVTFNNSSVGGVNYHWDFGDGTDTTVLDTTQVTHSFSNTSTTNPVTNKIVLTVLNSNNCPSIVSKDIIVQPIVQAGFSADILEGCHPLSVKFTNSSTGAITYNWNFFNGQSSGQKDPSMTFENFGMNDTIFNVRLMATNIQTCQDSFFVPILVHPYVDADFAIEYSRQCSPADVTFQNTSVNGQQYSWSFDGTPLVTTSTLPINRQFSNNSTVSSANYPVNLTVNSPQGCTSFISKQVSVYHRIEAGFSSITQGCQPLDVSFTNTSAGAREYRWEFGDNTSSILGNPQHIYTNGSNKDSIVDVKLTVISDNFCRDSLFSQITVYPGPKAKFTVNKTVDCSPLDITVQNVSESGFSYTWDFGDGSAPLTMSTTDPVNHSYINNSDPLKIHQLRLDVLTNQGCADFITQNVTVYSSVSVDFARDSAGCSPYYSEFSNLSQRSSTYYWNFGDASASYVNEPNHTFVNSTPSEKVFDVELRGQSEYGCADSIIKQITVYPSPEAKFSYAPIYQYFPSSSVTLLNETNQGSWDFEWDFDDGNTSSQMDPGSYSYSDWGEFNIKLSVSNSQCSDSVIHWIKIFPPLPIADFVPDIDSGCVPLVVSFTNNSIYGEEYSWNFDDGGTSTAFEPTHTFNKSGYYQVKLIAKGEGGEDFAFHEIQSFILPVPDFLVEPTLVMLPDQPVKVFNFTKHGASYLWDFGDGTTYNAKDTAHQYTELGVYDVSLTAWSEHGCEAYLNIPEAVEVIGKGLMIFPNAFAPSTSGPTGGQYNPNNPSNEIFFPVHDGVIDYNLVIYNRWGELVFETTDVNQGWDGYCGSYRCMEAVYVWQVKVEYSNGKLEVLVGDITLLHKKE